MTEAKKQQSIAKGKVGVVTTKDSRVKAAIRRVCLGSFLSGSVVRNPANIHEDAGLIPGLDHWFKDMAFP